MKSRPLQIVIAASSVIVRSGLAAILKRIPNQDLHPVEISSLGLLTNYMQLHKPDIIIVDPNFSGWFDLAAFKETNCVGCNTKFVAILSSMLNSQLLKEYNDSFTIYDDLDTITEKLNNLSNIREEAYETEESLSQREKEIIILVVKGMTNKEIADRLFLSVHTVITHRRNIARKLQIHSPAGLTIYAILNKLVELKDIKENL